MLKFSFAKFSANLMHLDASSSALSYVHKKSLRHLMTKKTWRRQFDSLERVESFSWLTRTWGMNTLHFGYDLLIVCQRLSYLVLSNPWHMHGNCLALEGTVFHDERVVKSLKEKNVIPIRVDLTRRGAPGWALLKRISPVGAIPLTAIYHPGAEFPTQLAGLYNTEDLINALK